MSKKAIIVSCFDWYEKRLKPIITLLKSKGYEVSVFTSDFDHISKETITNKNDKQNYLHVKPYKKNLSVARIRSHLSFSKQIRKILSKENPDLIYCLVPVNSLVKVCSKYKEDHQECKLIYDIIDMWPESMPIKSLHNTPPFKLWRNYRDKYIARADYLITECDLYYSYLNKLVSENKHSTIYLYKEYDSSVEEYITSQINEYIKKPDVISLCYLGSINHIIDIDGILKVINKLTVVDPVELHIVGEGEAKQELIDRVSELGTKVIDHGKVFDEKKKVDIISQCDFGINMMKEGVVVGLTIKSMDYFCYGLPLINTIKGDTESLVREYKIGINIKDNPDVNIDPSYMKLEKHKDIHEMFLKLFSVTAYTRRINEVFDKLL